MTPLLFRVVIGVEADEGRGTLGLPGAVVLAAVAGLPVLDLAMAVSETSTLRGPLDPILGRGLALAVDSATAAATGTGTARVGPSGRHDVFVEYDFAEDGSRSLERGGEGFLLGALLAVVVAEEALSSSS